MSLKSASQARKGEYKGMFALAHEPGLNLDRSRPHSTYSCGEFWLNVLAEPGFSQPTYTCRLNWVEKGLVFVPPRVWAVEMLFGF